MVFDFLSNDPRVIATVNAITIIGAVIWVIGIVILLWNRKTKVKNPRLRDKNFHEEDIPTQPIHDDKKEIISGEITKDVDDIKRLESIAPVKAGGYLFYKGKEIFEDPLIYIIGSTTIFLAFFLSPLIIAFIFQIPATPQGVIAFLVFGFLGIFYGRRIAKKHYIVIELKNKKVFRFSGGLFGRLPKNEISVYAQQIDYDKWIPMIVINGLIIAEGGSVSTKVEALNHFKNDGKIIADFLDIKLKRTWYEWYEWRKKLSKAKRMYNRVFKKTQ